MHLLIFDLDGTLIDSSRDLAISTNAMLRHLGKAEVDEKTVNTFVGDGAPKLVRRALGGDPSDAEFHAAYEFFIRYYRSHSLEHTRLYPGIREALDELKQAGCSLAVLTNKPVKISRDILSGLGVHDLFLNVYGGDSFPSKKPDPVGIYTLIAEAAAAEAATADAITADTTTMIGDSSVDIATARNAGVRACGVTWGFKPESLRDPEPDLLVDDPRRLADTLIFAPRPF